MKFNEHMIKSGFLRSLHNECVYIKSVGGAGIAYLLLYVDDIFLAGANLGEIEKVKEELRNTFEMKDLGPARRILGMFIVRRRESKKIWLTQGDYVSRLLKKFKMESIKEVVVPMGQHYKLTAGSETQE